MNTIEKAQMLDTITDALHRIADEVKAEGLDAAALERRLDAELWGLRKALMSQMADETAALLEPTR